MDSNRRPHDLTRLFIGGAVQWAVAVALTRLSVFGGIVSVFVATFIGQSLWWINIQHTTRDSGWPRWLAWCLGAAVGAVIGRILT